MKLKYKSKMRQRQREKARAIKVATNMPKPKTTSADRMRKLRAKRKEEEEDTNDGEPNVMTTETEGLTCTTNHGGGNPQGTTIRTDVEVVPVGDVVRNEAVVLDEECIIVSETINIVPFVKVEPVVDEPDSDIPAIQVDIEMERDGEIKFEIEEQPLVCRICLSGSREMLPLDKYEELYKSLLFDKSQDQDIGAVYTFGSMQVCWECLALLRSVDRFRRRVRKAYDMFHTQEELPSLSSLSTSVFTNSNSKTVYITEEDVPTDNIHIEIVNNVIEGTEVEVIRVDTQINEEEERINDRDVIAGNNEVATVTEGTQTNEEEERRENREDIVENNEVATVTEGTQTNEEEARRENHEVIVENNEVSTVTKGTQTNEEEEIIENRDVVLENNEVGILRVGTQTNEDEERRNNRDVIVENNLVETIRKDTQANKAEESNKKKIEKNKHSRKRKPKCETVNCHDEVFRRVILNYETLQEVLAERSKEERYIRSKNKCLSCIQTFRDETELMKHKRSYHDKRIRSFVCDICQSRFSDDRQLTTHLSNHYNIFYCNLCSFKCTNEYETKIHGQLHGSKFVKCLECGRLFSGRRVFYSHYKEAHEIFICDNCGLKLKTKSSIIRHIRKKHTQLECKKCNRKFGRYNSLWLHNKVFHGPPTGAVRCEECDLTFSHTYRYKWHLTNSTKHRPRKKTRFPCPKCKKNFTEKAYMENHYNLVHLKTSKYQCELCKKKCGRKADLVKHQRQVHDGILPPKDKICHICGLGFTTNHILTKHIRTHTGERPFACTHCRATFTQAYSLTVHKKKMHRERRKKK